MGKAKKRSFQLGIYNQFSSLSREDAVKTVVKLLEENPDIIAMYRERFQYVSVDEYQDIDENQYKLIRLLVPEDGKICAIGDPNQAIYGFRGGDSKFFKNFTQISYTIFKK